MTPNQSLPSESREEIDDLKPFKHGQEGTHYACDAMLGKGCCACLQHVCGKSIPQANKLANFIHYEVITAYQQGLKDGRGEV